MQKMQQQKDQIENSYQLQSDRTQLSAPIQVESTTYIRMRWPEDLLDLHQGTYLRPNESIQGAKGVYEE
jgi:hypothetical protein